MRADCSFCHLDYSQLKNTIIEETDSFRVIPGTGALVDGYLLIVTKRHYPAMSELSSSEQLEYRQLLKKYRTKFKSVYDQFPVIFEHGSPDTNSRQSANSIFHAHTHIMNHHFINELHILQTVNLIPCELTQLYRRYKNYIFYLNPRGQAHISYHFPSDSQLMRRFIANDLKIPHQYDWHHNQFPDNILKTIQKFQDKN